MNTKQIQLFQFNSAFEEYSDPLYKFCLRKISDSEIAKDLLQETFFRAWRYMSEGNAVKKMKPFLFRIIGNLIIDQYRKRSPDESLETLYEKGFDPGCDDTGHLIASIDGAQALVCLDEIREPYRKTIRMRYVQQLSIREIACMSHAEENTVVVRIHRGLHILHELLGE